MIKDDRLFLLVAHGRSEDEQLVLIKSDLYSVTPIIITVIQSVADI